MKNSLGQKAKIQMGLETEAKRKKRVAREKKENASIHEYFDRIHAEDKKKRKPAISTDQFKSLFWKEGKEYFRRLNRPFIVDENNKHVLDLICKYFANDPEFETQCKGELRKGLLVYGPCGTGKSSLFDIVQNISRKYNLMQFWFTNISVHNVVTQYNLEGEYVVEKYTKGKVHFDDLGTEKLANSWGVKEKLMGRILELRYNEFKRKGTRTFVTTNLSLYDLKKFYGEGAEDSRNRILSRLYEMFNMIPLEGEDRRF